MTILVAAASPEAIALAADSRTTQRSGAHHRVTSDSAHKVFAISDRFGIGTYGSATIDGRTIAGLIDEWQADHSPPTNLTEIAHQFGEFFQAKLDAVTPVKRTELSRLLPQRWPLGLLVAGYEDGGTGRLLEVKIDARKFEVDDTKVGTEHPSVLFRGQTSPLRRLIFGVDADEMRSANIHLPEEIQNRLSTLEYELIDPVTAQDAVDFAFFLVDTTIRMQRFSDGTVAARRMGQNDIPGCGGPIQGLVVRPRRIEWIHRNDLVAPMRGPTCTTGPD